MFSKFPVNFHWHIVSKLLSYVNVSSISNAGYIFYSCLSGLTENGAFFLVCFLIDNGELKTATKTLIYKNITLPKKESVMKYQEKEGGGGGTM